MVLTKLAAALYQKTRLQKYLAPQSPAVVSTGAKISRIVELLEQILIDVGDPLDLHQARSVSRAFNATIEGSSSLQWLMFLNPTNSDLKVSHLRRCNGDDHRNCINPALRLGGIPCFSFRVRESSTWEYIRPPPPYEGGCWGWIKVSCKHSETTKLTSVTVSVQTDIDWTLPRRVPDSFLDMRIADPCVRGHLNCHRYLDHGAPYTGGEIRVNATLRDLITYCALPVDGKWPVGSHSPTGEYIPPPRVEHRGITKRERVDSDAFHAFCLANLYGHGIEPEPWNYDWFYVLQWV